MKRLALLTVALMAGCKGTIVGPLGTLPRAGEGTDPVPFEVPTSNLPGPMFSGALCEGAPAARTFLSLTGEPLEADRVNTSIDLDRRRTRTWESTHLYIDDLNRLLGYYLAANDFLDLATVPVRPSYSYAEVQMGALELYSQFRVGFVVCHQLIDTPREAKIFKLEPLRSAPTFASAKEQCRNMMRQFWREDPTTEQVDSCATFAVEETADLPTVSERWALVCASILSSTGATTQ